MPSLFCLHHPNCQRLFTLQVAFHNYCWASKTHQLTKKGQLKNYRNVLLGFYEPGLLESGKQPRPLKKCDEVGWVNWRLSSVLCTAGPEERSALGSQRYEDSSAKQRDIFFFFLRRWRRPTVLETALSHHAHSEPLFSSLFIRPLPPIPPTWRTGYSRCLPWLLYNRTSVPRLA